VLSYRQIIKAYSSSGGAYVVSRDNFGGLGPVSKVGGFCEMLPAWDEGT
jgi:hypothetical protein